MFVFPREISCMLILFEFILSLNSLIYLFVSSLKSLNSLMYLLLSFYILCPEVYLDGSFWRNFYRNGGLREIHCLTFHTIFMMRPGQADFLCWLCVWCGQRRLGWCQEVCQGTDRVHQAGLVFFVTPSVGL